MYTQLFTRHEPGTKHRVMHSSMRYESNKYIQYFNKSKMVLLNTTLTVRLVLMVVKNYSM